MADKKRSAAQILRQATRTAQGKYDTLGFFCEICGKKLGWETYYSHPDCDSTGIGQFLCKKHRDSTLDEIKRAKR